VNGEVCDELMYVATYRMTRNAIKYLLEDTKGREYVGEFAIGRTYNEHVT
jgi:hypothetical protein